MENTAEVKLINKTTLPSGLRILTEHVPGVKSVSVGIWVKTGSRNETEEEAGITHFLEHMLFKGTEKRSSYDIALSMEAVGGYLNAFTSSEYTCYYSRCLDSELETALDVLSDMVLHPTFPENEIEKEKNVVIEEMKMYRDNPEEYAFESFSGQIFKNHPLGRPVIGYEETVNNFSRDDLYHYMSEHYQPWNLVISVAGNTDHQKVVDLVTEYFENVEYGEKKEYDVPLSEYQVDQQRLTKDIEQTHLILGKRGLKANHDDRYLLLLANTILGGGMSSRLHQNVREQYGYCYSIQTFNQVYRDSGIYGVYVGTDQDYVDHVKELIFKEFDKIRDKRIPEKELSEAKSQLKGKLLLSQENMSSRMNRLAKSELYFKRFITLDELVENIDQVGANEIRDFAEEFYDEPDFSETLLVPQD